jgi:Protein of unknown function (DUF4242)
MAGLWGEYLMTVGCHFLTLVLSSEDDRSERRREMPKYLIERTVAGAGQMDSAALAAIAHQSNTVLRDLGPDIQWMESYVTDDKITCVYVAASEEIVREHGRCGGFPIDAVHAVSRVIDPTTAEVLS